MLVIRKSKIHGKGVFASQNIPARKKVGEYIGERISIREARRRARLSESLALVEIDDFIAIDETVNGGPFRFINHSCSPNVFIRIAYGHVEFYASRVIRKGQELTCDYVDSHHNGKLPCLCSSSRCKRFI